uniref:Putative serine protease 7 n=1 Tax=Ciona intestinalis TaxID=7719 RepID=Q659T9_CIOIN|nr:sp7 protein precursor [Ciona intestinalis]CAH39865.1 putative serine protease 7 [Ciona intestinalis]
MKYIFVAFLSILCCASSFDYKCSRAGSRCHFPFFLPSTNQTYHECPPYRQSALWCVVNRDGRLVPTICVPCLGDGECYVKANDFPSQFTLECPRLCAFVTANLWGTNVYSNNSFVCSSAIHAGIYPATVGGTIKRIDRPASYTGSPRNALRSKTIISSHTAFRPTRIPTPSFPGLIYTVGNKIEVISSTRRHDKLTLVSEPNRIISVDLDTRRNFVFWIIPNTRQIMKATFSDDYTSVTDTSVLQGPTSVNKPIQLSYDWVHEVIYWTDAHSVRVAMTTSNHITFLINRGSQYQPDAIQVDPESGYVYISDTGSSPKIEKCSMGNPDSRTLVASENVQQPTALTIESSTSKVYWFDSSTKTLNMCHSSGTDCTVILSSNKIINFPVGMFLNDNKVYWIDAGDLTIKSVNQRTGERLHLSAAGLHRPSSIKSLDQLNQPMVRKRCQHSDCPHFCLPAGRAYRCVCPYNVPSCNHTFQQSNVQIFIADDDIIRRLNVNMLTGSITGDVIKRGLINAADVAYSSITSKLYWSNETSSQSRITKKEGVAVDWIHHNLYWTDATHNKVMLAFGDEGNLENISTLIERNSVYRPRAIALDPLKGYMYISDIGSNPKIEKCWMDGEHCMIIVDENIQLPNGIALDFTTQKMFWTDGRLKTLSFSNFDGSNRTILLDDSTLIGQAYGIGVFYNRVFWTDLTSNALFTISKTPPVRRQAIMTGLVEGKGIKLIAQYNQPQGDNVCAESSDCSICVPVPHTTNTTRSSCVCPDHLRVAQSNRPECRKHTLTCRRGLQPDANYTGCVDIDECVTNTHLCEQICFNYMGSYLCICRDDFTLNLDGRSCYDAGCSSSPCMNGGLCSDVANGSYSYTCQCLQGFRGRLCNEIYSSMNVVLSGNEVSFECIVPRVVTSVIKWYRNRERITTAMRSTFLTFNGRLLRIFFVTYLEAGNYKCQFEYGGLEYASTHFLEVPVQISAVCGQAPSIPDRIGGRITSGVPTAPFDGPFIAMLVEETNEGSETFCGGSIATRNKIITAAHCLQNDEINITSVHVFVGKVLTDVTLIEPYQQHSLVSHVVFHENYDPDNLNSDIAILTLSTQIVFTKAVKPLCIPLHTDTNQDIKPRPYRGTSKMGLVLGYGRTSHRGPVSTQLREVLVEIRTQQFCTQRYRTVDKEVTSVMFCAGGGAQDACSGDSGGPFALWSNRTQSWWLAGIVSWGPRGCGVSNLPGVYTRIGTSMRQWIHNHI